MANHFMGRQRALADHAAPAHGRATRTRRPAPGLLEPIYASAREAALDELRRGRFRYGNLVRRTPAKRAAARTRRVPSPPIKGLRAQPPWEPGQLRPPPTPPCSRTPARAKQLPFV
ncbi:hypothetical protein EVAR_12769_1 [Eumeta japonica]|uniref:Uncharacterized protein n=1 Tax=Eumeta variegata TaxID=151549 RepID=A0A4C1UAZ2_EUMVA|nr:hypothetical protein EVAR_12769_1 [Eumeta japonica]